ncbi:MAG: tyrosine-type recombinase/integrase, partial [Bacillota bacterium]|nr:tyrosine-type recombinase/integrase [Bacillota bacterium]
GTKQGKPISTSTIDRFVKNAAVNAGIDKNINPHIFRHTFGTHLYEQGTDLLTIQKLLGHKSINSTTIYVHLASTIYKDTINPFDYEDQSYELSH